jgi:hypothetical protein
MTRTLSSLASAWRPPLARLFHGGCNHAQVAKRHKLANCFRDDGTMWLSREQLGNSQRLRSDQKKMEQVSKLTGAVRISGYCYAVFLQFVCSCPSGRHQDSNWRVITMHAVSRLMIATASAIALMHLSGIAAAETAKQIKLTDKQIEGFIAAQGDMPAVSEKIEATASDKPDPTMQAELENIAKMHGFKSLGEYDDVAATISMVMAGIDPRSKEFTDPKIAIQKEIDEVKADASMPENEKKQMLDELAGAMDTAQPIQDPGNIEIVQRYYDNIDAAMR